MKKKLFIILTAVTVLLAILSLTACSASQTGENGDNDKYLPAYELAVENGFEGTFDEWLASIKGESGTNKLTSEEARIQINAIYQAAVDDGFQGTFNEWLASLTGKDGKDGANGKDGADGKDGKDALVSIEDIYQAAVENGYEGTFLEFCKEYLNVEIVFDNAHTIAENLISSVTILCGFNVTTISRSLDLSKGGWVENKDTQKKYSAGSGVFYKIDKNDGSAYVITNYHVVFSDECDEENGISQDIRVFLYGGNVAEQAIKAEYVGGSMNYDIAVLRITNSEAIKNDDVMTVEFADSNDIQVGEKAIAVGNAEGKGISATTGTVTVDSENITMTAADNQTQVNFRVIRTDTAVNSGNSGGGLFDADGKLIGIVNAKIKASGVEGIGYALPSNVVKNVVENILYYSSKEGYEGGVKKCMMGVTVLTQESKAIYDKEKQKTRIEEKVVVYEEYNEEEGVDTRIKEGALCYGKLQNGDVLKTFKICRNGVKNGDEYEFTETYEITRSYIVVDVMLTVRPGDVIRIEFERVVNGQTELMGVNLALDENCITLYK